MAPSGRQTRPVPEILEVELTRRAAQELLGRRVVAVERTDPLVVVGDERIGALRSGGALADVGPTILSMMGIGQPPEMTGTNLGEF